jgi:uncharacterized protein YukE
MELSIDFVRAEKQARTLEQCTDELQRQSREIGEIISEVRRTWQGETANAYIRKLEAFERTLISSTKRCNEVAADFRTKIGALRKAEAKIKAAMAQQ